MTIDEMIDVLQAAKEGKTIQVRRSSVSPWEDCSAPVWEFNACEYRAKPEPREWWLVDASPGHWHEAFSCKKPAEERLDYIRLQSGKLGQVVHVREVLEG